MCDNGLTARLGAGLLVSGAMVGTTEQLTLTASITRTNGDETHAGSVSGPVDSVLALVGDLALQLLMADRGVAEYLEDADVVDVPREALEAYLEAHQAWGPDRDESLRQFLRALDVDSTFALAALNGWEAAFNRDDALSLQMQERGRRLALQHRDRLSDADRGYAEAYAVFSDNTGYPFGGVNSPSKRLEAARDAAEKWPNHSGILIMLLQFSLLWADGAYTGWSDWGPTALNALERGYRMDGGESRLEKRAGFMVGSSIWAGDTARVRTYASIGVGLSDQSPYNRLLWFRLLGDSAGADSMWATADEWCGRSQAFQWHWPHARLPLEDWERCNAILGRSVVTRDERSLYLREEIRLALLSGQAQYAVALNDTMVAEDLYGDAYGHVRPIHWWLSGPGYEAAARFAAHVFDSIQSAWPDSIIENWNNPWERTCFVALGNVVRGDAGEVRETIALLKGDNYYKDSWPTSEHRDCPWLLEILLEARLDPGGDAPMLNRLDSIMPLFGVLPPNAVSTDVMNLIIARLRVARGEWKEALAAVARRHPQRTTPHLVPGLFIEGQAYEALGDYELAIENYGHYLDIRTHPDSGAIRDEWEEVRRWLAALVERERRE